MEIPRFWASASKEVTGKNKQLFKCWGWSNQSMAEAKEKAAEVLSRLTTRVMQGAPIPDRYGYGDRALREEIIREISTGDGSSPDSVITRNSYGALIINTSRVMFIDVDAPVTLQKSSFLGAFKKSKEDPAESILQKIRQGLSGYGASFRIYRTAAGFRVLATDPLFEPASSEAEQLMQSVGADPAFVKLCRAQRSFRARLTPKPWRCGTPKPPGSFPREDSIRTMFMQWLSDYEAASASRATCRFLESVGLNRINEHAEQVLEIHDRTTKSDSTLPLA